MKTDIRIALAALAVGACMVSCSNDDGPSYTERAVTDTELLTVLQAKGFEFNEQGQLQLNDLANNTTTLDLSGTEITPAALAGLDILPALTEVNLQNNGYGETFDFSVLPAQITGVDLRGNDIYNYDNLVNVTVAENGDETVENLRTVTKLYLPETAKYNIAQLMRFYRQNKDAIDAGTMDVEMVNSAGTLEKYNTLRDIPCEALRNYLNGDDTFSELFSGDQIDISKVLSSSQRTNNIYINQWFVEDITAFTNLDGLQYIVNNPYWAGTYLVVQLDEMQDLPKLKIGETVTLINFINLNMTNGIDLSSIRDLYYIQLQAIESLETIDLSASEIWGQRDLETESDAMYGSTLTLLDCPDLTEIVFPAANNLKALTLDLEYLNKVTSLDLSRFEFVGGLQIGDLSDNCDLKYPVLTQFPTHGIPFSCSVKTYGLDVTKKFIEEYSTDRKIYCYSSLSCDKNEAAWWE